MAVLRCAVRATKQIEPENEVNNRAVTSHTHLNLMKGAHTSHIIDRQ